eukprot:TRINITY_DN32997_c0_g1_i1.p1 TRINITY_DN32997_c0_g1~~TRINITY_DN32997_c0_g1_i1.p1  ORF type:complete len:628 (-),score=101.39 TRINITY_DN32997_c0_g1_i1:112-1995(-)
MPHPVRGINGDSSLGACWQSDLDVLRQLVREEITVANDEQCSRIEGYLDSSRKSLAVRHKSAKNSVARRVTDHAARDPQATIIATNTFGEEGELNGDFLKQGREQTEGADQRATEFSAKSLLSDEMCLNCGNNFMQDAIFCRHCGRRRDAEKTASMMPVIDVGNTTYLERLKLTPQLHNPKKLRTAALLKSTAERPGVLGLEQFVDSKMFQSMQVFAILSSVAVMGIEADLDIKGALATPQMAVPEAVNVINILFCIVFCMEIALKIIAYRMDFLVGDDKYWNLFDSLLVIMQIVELAMQAGGVAVVRVLRLLRIIRTLRVIRLLHFFRDLRMMIVCIGNSFMSLLWASVLFSTITYVFAILCLQGTTAYLREGLLVPEPTIPSPAPGLEEIAGAFQIDDLGPAGLQMQILLHFRSLSRTIMSLMMSVTGGLDWYQIAKPLMNIGGLYSGAFFFYVALILICVLNVLSAVFIEAAFEIKDRDLLIQAEMARIDSFLRDMAELFGEADPHGNGSITRTELRTYMKNDRVAAYFSNQGLDMSDVGLMFDLLDRSGNGGVELPEFLVGTLRLKGSARCIEVMRLFQALDHLRVELASVQKHMGINPSEFNPSSTDLAVEHKNSLKARIME